MAGGQLGTGLRDAAAEIMRGVPLRRAHFGQELLHRGLVAVEQLAVEMTGIPVQQHPAEIEHHGADTAHVRRPAKPRLGRQPARPPVCGMQRMACRAARSSRSRRNTAGRAGRMWRPIPSPG